MVNKKQVEKIRMRILRVLAPDGGMAIDDLMAAMARRGTFPVVTDVHLKWLLDGEYVVFASDDANYICLAPRGDDAYKKCTLDVPEFPMSGVFGLGIEID